MYKNKKILALIPARGGSKGLPGKNTRQLHGKPLIAWTIEKAMKSEFLDEVFVSTDSEEIAGVSKEIGAEAFPLRPAGLATDSSNIIDTIKYVCQMYEERERLHDFLLLLEPTSPLRKNTDIDAAIRALLDNENGAESLVSVGEISLEHPAYVKKVDGKGFLRPYFNNGNESIQRQGLDTAYFPYGVIYLASVKAIKKHNTVYAGKILPFFIDRWQNYEINDIYDFMCVEAIMSMKEREMS